MSSYDVLFGLSAHVAKPLPQRPLPSDAGRPTVNQLTGPAPNTLRDHPHVIKRTFKIVQQGSLSSSSHSRSRSRSHQLRERLKLRHRHRGDSSDSKHESASSNQPSSASESPDSQSHQSQVDSCLEQLFADVISDDSDTSRSASDDYEQSFIDDRSVTPDHCYYSFPPADLPCTFALPAAGSHHVVSNPRRVYQKCCACRKKQSLSRLKPGCSKEVAIQVDQQPPDDDQVLLANYRII